MAGQMPLPTGSQDPIPPHMPSGVLQYSVAAQSEEPVQPPGPASVPASVEASAPASAAASVPASAEASGPPSVAASPGPASPGAASPPPSTAPSPAPVSVTAESPGPPSAGSPESKAPPSTTPPSSPQPETRRARRTTLKDEAFMNFAIASIVARNRPPGGRRDGTAPRPQALFSSSFAGETSCSLTSAPCRRLSPHAPFREHAVGFTRKALWVR